MAHLLLQESSVSWIRSWSGVLWRILPLSGEMTNKLVWLLVLVLRNSLRDTVGQMPPQGFRYVSYEVTIPRKLIPKYGEEELQNVNYWLQIEGEGYVVHLKLKKGFVPKHFPVFTYNEKGDLQVDYPFIRSDCFYHGFVWGKPLSLAVLSMCSGGLRGLLQVGNKTYVIEPVQGSASFQHVVYQLEEKEGTVHMRCGLKEEEPSRQKPTVQNTENIRGKRAPEQRWWTHARYAKVAVVVEHERYVQFGKNETLIANQVLDIIHIADSLYKPLGVHVFLVGLEIWSEKNFIAIADTLEPILDDFNRWRQDILAPRLSHDVSHLFVYKTFGTTLGLAFVEGVCNPEHASGVESYTTSNLLSFALIFTHELGHNLGMFHDKEDCTCSVSDCIMSQRQTHSNQFSNCSFSSYYRLMTHGNTECLRIPPDHQKLYTLKYCGNKIVDYGEQCDCGSELQCERDPCCQSNCMLRSGAACASGKCCSSCQYLPVGTVCRERTNFCDLTEYCSGTSERCPKDVYVQDGAPCSSIAYCYHGLCSTHIKQCRTIFGKKATVASESCFGKVNAQGDRFGNCGITTNSYKECKAKDILCGRIQCENVDNLPYLEEHSTIVQTPLGNRLCWGTDYHGGIEKVDIGAVTDGTPCGRNMMCINRKCSRVSLLKYDCNITKCHNRGICNNHKHCHCDYGWAPPDCLNKGYGGSIDSGPPPKRKTSSVGAGTIVGIVFALSATVFGVGLCVYYGDRLRQPFRKSNTKLYPTA
ncbi:disintegrin and metalloproteinase domain-containing protein 20-like [Hemicordylus capensis]|uniref:disintegrin and metalloproteinase domain-containing protein 20-like n=1 Tax=Hemicordylus capensis TaxID=884348 RepID=UPI002302AA9B|nr:disintegrin and metalloproteinase domain-containing protein 20-like [Hemicordylus capensis]